MGKLLVGPNNEKLFKKRTTWDFNEALVAANDGDIIELQEDFWVYNDNSNSPLIIDKNITIQGHIRFNEENTRIFTTFIENLVITNGATVTLKDIGVFSQGKIKHALIVKGKATLIAEQVYIEDRVNTGNYSSPIVIQEEANASFDDCFIPVHPRANGGDFISLKNSTVEVANSTFNIGISIENTTLSMKSSFVQTNKSFALAAKSSTIHATDMKFTGGKLTTDKKVSCMHLLNSHIQLENTRILQANYHKALIIKDSTLSANQVTFDSIVLNASKGKLVNVKVNQNIQIINQSHVESNLLSILGRDNGLIPLIAKENSTLRMGIIQFGHIYKVNVRLERDVNFHVDQMVLLNYDYETKDYIINPDGKITILNKVVPLDYIGKEPAMKRLRKMIGFQKIKTDVEEFIAVAELNKKRQTQGLNDPALSLHALFTGNPGTGKKNVARMISEILYENKVFSKVVFVEASRTNLIGNDSRETVLKTRKVLESALGGVLFINEAYTLAAESSKDFGVEAVNEILNFMENHRKDLVIIFAGDAGEMEKFLNMNIDLKSRIPNVFAFPNYTVDELIQIGLDNLFKQNYQINESSYRKLVYNNYEYTYDESNRHWVQNINDQIIKRLALRTSKNNDKRITTISDEDLESLMLTPPLSIDS